VGSSARFGKYLLIDKLGTGGMAELFLAKQTGLKGFEKVIAIKRILPHLTENPEFVSMFINEAKLAALLSHQNIVQIYDLGSVVGIYYIAMEYIMGKDLRAVLSNSRSKNRPLPISHILQIISRILSGLDYAHRQKDLTGRELNIVHRDVSPQNILVSYEGEVKVVDFGIAKAASLGGETRTGVLKGKLAYMSPEQAWGKLIDRRSDIFAVGIILYEMLSGTRLFKGENELSTLEKVRETKVEPPASLNAEISKELEAITLKALAKDPNDRFQTASEMEAAIEAHMISQGQSLSPISLSQYLHHLFEQEIQQDTARFHTASTATEATVMEQQSTLARPAGLPPTDAIDKRDATPSTKIRPRPASITERRPKSQVGGALFIFSVMAVMLILALSYSNPPFWQKIKEAYPRIRYFDSRLHQFPQDLIAWLKESPESENAGFPAPSANATPQDRTPLVEASPPQASSVANEAPPAVGLRDDKARMILSSPQGFNSGAARGRSEEVQRLFAEAKMDYQLKNYSQVEKKLRQIIELDPQEALAYHLLGTLFLERDDEETAMKIFSEGSGNLPQAPLLHYDLGFLYYKRGITSLAKLELSKALALRPSAPQAGRAREILAELNPQPTEENP
jgi:serine/threonine protein kinase